jgi:hypothetical protein
MNRFVMKTCGLLACVAGLTAMEATALGQSVRSGRVVLSVNDAMTFGGQSGYAVTELYTPTTNLAGEVGFGGRASNGLTDVRFVWRETGVLFSSLDAPLGTTFAGLESSCGLGSDGRFLIGPSIDDEIATGRDAIWSQNGLVIAERDPAPGAPGLFVRANSAPSMFGASGAAWVSTTSTTPTGGTSGRLFFRMTNDVGAVPQVVFRIGDVVFPAPDNFPIKFASPTISFKYEISDNGLHHIHHLGLDTGSTLNDAYIYLDGMPIAREGSPTGSPFGQLWGSFSLVSVNDLGQYLVYGLAAGSVNSDATLNFNGTGIILEQDPYAGIDLVTPAFCQGVSLNNNGAAAFIWAYGPDTDPNTTGTQQAKTLFLAENVNDFANTGLVVLTTGDLLDTNGDLIGDVLVKDLRPDQLTSPGLDLAEDGRVSVKALIAAPSGGNEREAIIVLDLALGCPADWNGDGGVDGDDVIAFFGEWDANNADYNGDGGTDGDDVIAFFADWDSGC